MSSIIEVIHLVSTSMAERDTSELHSAYQEIDNWIMDTGEKNAVLELIENTINLIEEASND